MRLLVSVRNAGEAEAALAGGADVIDAKDPAGGALGAAGPAALRAIRALVTPPAQFSAALGDAPPLPGTFALAAYGAALCGADYVKVGLLARERKAALELLVAVRRGAEAADPKVRVVAVAYADAETAGAFPPLLAPELARAAGLHGVLLDTLAKNGGTSLSALGERDVGAFVRSAHAAGLEVGLAGSLTLADVPRALSLGPDLVGVRGSACDGGRMGRVSTARVRALREALEATAAHR